MKTDIKIENKQNETERPYQIFGCTRHKKFSTENYGEALDHVFDRPHYCCLTEEWVE